MRVIWNNNAITVTCRHCKSVLAVTVEDIRDVMTVGTHVMCAACEKTTPVALELIPQSWRSKIEWDE